MHASRVLRGSEPFVASDAGYAVALAGDPAVAVGRRGGLSLALPKRAAEALRFHLLGGFEMRVRENGASGDSRVADGAVAYGRKGGTSFWSATEQGYEEWLMLDAGVATGKEPVATWEIEGATVRQGERSIEIAGADGVTKVHVTAPVAFAASGVSVPVRLSTSGSRIELFVDSAGEPVLVDPVWSSAAPLAGRHQHHAAITLTAGKVMVTGGHNGTTYVGTVELYNPSDGSWTSLNPLNSARGLHAAVELASGKVLVIGGHNGAVPLQSAEIYDPSQGPSATWALTGNMVSARYRLAAVRLGSSGLNKVLVTGGSDGSNQLNTAEIYDPNGAGGGTWASAGTMSDRRWVHTSTLLGNGKVLVAGGYNGTSGYLTSAQLYDPATGWATPTTMLSARGSHRATRLNDGNVLLTGGINSGGELETTAFYTTSSNTWSAVAPMATRRAYHTATLLGNGKVLVAGGYNTATNDSLATTEVYDPAANSWTPGGSMFAARRNHAASALLDGRVLISGGLWGSALLSAELYEPAADAWAGAAALGANRWLHTATRLQDGRVWVAGGTNSVLGDLSTTYVYDPSANSWTSQASMAVARQGHTATLLQDGTVLVVGGSSGGTPQGNAQVYRPATNDYLPGVPGMAVGRTLHTATLLPGGKVLVAGGLNGSARNTVEIYDPSTKSWTATGAMNTARYAHTAVLIGAGATAKVLVAGGYSTSGWTQTAELYDQQTGSWTTVTSMSAARGYHTASLLSNGKVLVAGGRATTFLMSAEIYDPTAGSLGSWTTVTVPMSTPRANHTATNMVSGWVLIAGGYGGSATSSVDIYDVATNTWLQPAAMSAARYQHTATLLGSGKVLMVGGYNLASTELYTSVDDGNSCTTEAWNTALKEVTHNNTPGGAPCADDGNPCTSDTCNGAGVCQHTNVANGTSCGVGLICSTGGCASGCLIGGTFYASGAVNSSNACQVCTPSSSTSAWSARANGTSCNDGNACTQTDTCQAGVCTGSNPVVCAVPDQCHDGGTCNPSTGVCSNPPKANGTACNDGDACTQTDTCQAGVCTGSNPVVCAPPDQCHTVGCNPSTGVCFYPHKAVACNDGNPCTTDDFCGNNEMCAGTPYTCMPTACQATSTCDGNGGCTVINKPSGAPCTDGDPNNGAEVCDGQGQCIAAGLLSIDVPACGSAPPGPVVPPTLLQPLVSPLAPVVPAASKVGTLQGAGSVTPAGEYTYRISIDVAPGRAGMQPSLALVYSSRGRNGHLGVGWHLEGLSEINRCPKVFATEGRSDGVHFDANDALCLDGRKLIAIGGYTAKNGDDCSGTEYRTEENSFARIVACGPSGAQVARFKVWAKDGRIREYGAINTPIGSDSVPAAWPLTDERDRAGNGVHYTYTVQSGGIEYYPSRIEYTVEPGAGPAVNPPRRVDFIYNPDTDPRPDVETLFAGRVSAYAYNNAKTRVSRRLTSIDVYAPSMADPSLPELAWRYELGYMLNPANGWSLLSSVRRCGAKGGCLQAKQFTWETHRGPIYEPTSFVSATGELNAYVLDLDGDGRDDVVRPDLSDAQSDLVLTTENSSAPLQLQRMADGLRFPGGSAKVLNQADFDGDGRLDFLVAVPGNQHYEIRRLFGTLRDPSSPLSFLNVPTNITGNAPGHEVYDDEHDSPLHSIDLNGDGLPDLVKADYGTNWFDWSWSYRLNRYGSQNGWFFGSSKPVGKIGPPLDGHSYFAIDRGYRRGSIYVTSTASGALKGISPDGASITVPTATDTIQFAYADMNGDGIQELVQWDSENLQLARYRGSESSGWDENLWYETPEITSAAVEVPPPTDPADPCFNNVCEPKWRLRVADFDGDGRDDVLVTYLPIKYVQYSDSPLVQARARTFLFRLRPQDGHQILEATTLPVNPVDLVGDFDGDGLLDLVSYTWPDGYWHVYRQTGAGTVDRIVAVADEDDAADPAHAREVVKYSTEWSPNPDPTTCFHPQRCMRHGFAVVREWDVYQGKDVLGGLTYQRHLFNYEDPRFDVYGRDFLGFSTVRHWEPVLGAETITTYDNTTAVDGIAHEPTFENDFQDHTPNGIYSHAARPKKVVQMVHFKDAPDVARVTIVDYEYDFRRLNQDKTYFVHPKHVKLQELDAQVTVDLSDTAKVHLTPVGNLPRGFRTRDAWYLYDNYGNVYDEQVLTMDGVFTHSASTYDIRTEDWLVGLLKTRETTSKDSTVPYPPPTPRHVEYEYDARGLLCHVFVEKNNPDPNIPEVITYFRDAEGLVIATTASAAGVPARTTHVAYEPNERVYPAEVWNDLGHAKWFRYHPALGTVLATEDQNGVRTWSQYDDLGRLVRMRPEGGAETTIVYSAHQVVGSFGIETVGVNIDVKDATNAARGTTVDELGREIVRRHWGFDGSRIEQKMVYDARGRLFSVSRPGVGAASNDVTQYSYDGLGRLIAQTRPGFETTSYEHTFFDTLVTDPMGHKHRTTRDVDGRVVTTEELTGQGSLVTTYLYTDFSQLGRVTDPKGNDLVYRYDVRGRRVSIHHPDAGSQELRYNGLGDLTATFAAGSLARQYTYDGLGRVRFVTDGDGGVAETRWDLSLHGVGRPAYTESADGVRQDFAYDQYGRPTSKRWSIANEQFEFTMGYDGYGRLNQLTYPSAPNAAPFIVGRTYTSKGYLNSVNPVTLSPSGGPPVLGTPYWRADSRNADDAVTQATLGNAMVVTRSYNAATGRLEALSEGTALSLNYEYYGDGNVSAREDNILNRRDTFSYDALHRLTGWSQISLNQTKDVVYGYDDIGNLTDVFVNGILKEHNTYAANSLPHAIVGSYDGSFSYDPRGRQVTAPGRTVTFTEANLPRTVTTSAGTSTFAYDAADARVLKDGPAGAVLTLDGLYERRETAGGFQHVFYVHGGEGLVAQVTFDQTLGETRTEYVHRDPLGSAGAVTDEYGQVLERLYYEPFGGRRDVTGNPISAPAKDVLLGLTGHRYDDELGLVDMRGRVYDPKIRRFLTPDPHVTDPLFGQSYNAYSYVVNNPINLVDPTGFDWEGGCIGAECRGDFSLFSFSWGGGGGPSFGSALSPAGGSSSGTFKIHRPTGAPLLTPDQFRIASLPAVPGSSLGPVMGPPIGQAWADPFGAGFSQQIVSDLVNLVGYNKVMWEAKTPARELTERIAREPELGEWIRSSWRFNCAVLGCNAEERPPLKFELMSARHFDEIRLSGTTGGLKVVGGAVAVEALIPMYRAVSPAEFADIMKTGQFRPAPGGGSLVGKQFGLKMEEVLKFTDHYPDAAAIIKVEVPQSVLKQFDFSKSIDPFIFRNGVVTVQPGEQLRLLNSTFTGLEHAF